MNKKDGPMYDLYATGPDKKPYLVAYARRAKNSGWFVRVRSLNPSPTSEKLYIEDDVFPPEFMMTMAGAWNPNF